VLWPYEARQIGAADFRLGQVLPPARPGLQQLLIDDLSHAARASCSRIDQILFRIGRQRPWICRAGSPGVFQLIDQAEGGMKTGARIDRS
jgi:hypothetical protein